MEVALTNVADNGKHEIPCVNSACCMHRVSYDTPDYYGSVTIYCCFPLKGAVIVALASSITGIS